MKTQKVFKAAKFFELKFWKQLDKLKEAKVTELQSWWWHHNQDKIYGKCFSHLEKITRKNNSGFPGLINLRRVYSGL